MIIESMRREKNFCGMVAYTPEHVYNAWKRGNTLHFYILSNEYRKPWPTFSDVVGNFTACIKNGEIQMLVDGEAMTLYSHDELINLIRCAFPDDWHDVATIIETLLYKE